MKRPFGLTDVSEDLRNPAVYAFVDPDKPPTRDWGGGVPIPSPIDRVVIRSSDDPTSVAESGALSTEDVKWDDRTRNCLRFRSRWPSGETPAGSRKGVAQRRCSLLKPSGLSAQGPSTLSSSQRPARGVARCRSEIASACSRKCRPCVTPARVNPDGRDQFSRLHQPLDANLRSVAETASNISNACVRQ